MRRKLTAADIARKLGVDPKNLRSLMRRAGYYKRRPSSL